MTAESLFAVVLAGGSGTRFWPASRRLIPKQLLPLGPSAPDSLIQGTLARLDGLVEKSNIFVATGQHLLEATQKDLDLPESAYLAEPQAKNTAPCIAWAARVIARKSPNAVVCVLPSDQHVEDEVTFRKVLSEASLVAQTGAICTIGIVPTRPETGYGYIEKGSKTSLIEGASHQVARFVEKPDRPTAQGYLETGRYLWNAGIFVFRARDMVAAIERHCPALNRGLDLVDVAALEGAQAERSAVGTFFEECSSVSIDYAVMEKEQNLCVVPGDFGWSDLGSWQSAWELSQKDEQGNAAAKDTILLDSHNNLVADLRASGAKEKVITLVGVSDLIVVETEDALLVMPRERSQEVRDVVKELKDSERSRFT